ncbi:MAG TPA: hypothetical protein VFF06_04280 [Polyangia bacterium]|nr:hypothetical protein [Polyangia bacterium]
MELRARLLLGSLLIFSGCDATYAPLIRAGAYGAPGRLDAGRVEISATTGGVFIPQVFVPHVGYGVTDWFAVEAGGNIAPGAWYTAFAGTRFSLVPNRHEPVHFVGDLELGFGGGVGGARYSNAPQSSDSCPDCDGRTYTDRNAFGGYQGLGVGIKIYWFTLFLRARVEESVTTNVPVTIWPSAMIGFEFDVRRVVSFTLGGGFIGYHDDTDAEPGWFYQLGLTFFIDTKRDHAP